MHALNKKDRQTPTVTSLCDHLQQIRRVEGVKKKYKHRLSHNTIILLFIPDEKGVVFGTTAQLLGQ